MHDFVSLIEISGAVIVALRGVKMMQVHTNLTALLKGMKLSVALKTLLGT